MAFHNPLTQYIADFLCEIGLEVLPSTWVGETFLPGIQVSRGRLLVNEKKLLYPGDLLHEAGHLAVLPQAQRMQADGQIAAGANEEITEVAAIAWSYAATIHLQLDPAVVFHPHGYHGNAAGLLLSFQMGVNPGLTILVTAGMTLAVEAAREQGVPGYPHMRQWLRN